MKIQKFNTRLVMKKNAREGPKRDLPAEDDFGPELVQFDNRNQSLFFDPLFAVFLLCVLRATSYTLEPDNGLCARMEERTCIRVITVDVTSRCTG